MSRKTSTTPTTFSSSSRIGAPLSPIGTSVPSRPTSRVWLAIPTTVPPRITSSTGLTAAFRVSSSTMRNTSSRGRPVASSAQPVRLRASSFISVTRPSASVTMTPSPMLVRVVRSCSRSLKRAAAARCCAERRRRATAKSMPTSASPRPALVRVVATDVR